LRFPNTDSEKTCLARTSVAAPDASLIKIYAPPTLESDMRVMTEYNVAGAGYLSVVLMNVPMKPNFRIC
jgi:hypothetical protein